MLMSNSIPCDGPSYFNDVCVPVSTMPGRASLQSVNPLMPTVANMGIAIKHPVPYRVKPSFVIFDIRALWRSGLSVRVPRRQKLQMTV